MTTAVVIRSERALTLALPEQWLRLLDERESFRKVDDGNGCKRWARIKLLPLTEAEAAALSEMMLVLDMRLKPGLRQTLVESLARIANHYNSERSPSEWQMLFEDYIQDLGEFSDATVSQALAEHRRESPWFPKIADLYKRCVEIRELDRCRLDRCRRALSEGG